jgi:hypothetical protein
MAAIAAERERARIKEKGHGLSELVHSPAVAGALVSGAIAVIVAVLAPTLAQKWQNHAKRLEVRTTLATDMSKSFTLAVGAGQRVASGLIYGPTGNRRRNAAVVQAAYNSGLGQWQVDGGRITAELTSRYAGSPIIHDWKVYRLAVTRFYRLSAAIPGNQRGFFVRYVRKYYTNMQAVPWAASALPAVKPTEWAALGKSKKFRKSLGFRRSYDKVSSSFLSLGDAFVAEMLTLRPQV